MPSMPGSFPSPVSHTAEHLHTQAMQMDSAADNKEAQAIEIRTAATVRGLGEKIRLKKMIGASSLEEEAENCRREAGRLRAEAEHLDGELARELGEQREDEEVGQVSGVIRH